MGLYLYWKGRGGVGGGYARYQRSLVREGGDMEDAMGLLAGEMRP